MHAERIVQMAVLVLFVAAGVLPLSYQPPMPAPAARPAAQDTLPEQPIQRIPIAGVLADKDAEISGLAWYEDHLIILPQHPRRIADRKRVGLFAVSKTRLLAFLEGRSSSPIIPRRIPLVAPELDDHVGSFQGYEALAFDGHRAFVTVESAQDPAQPDGAMQGYLLTGEMAPDLSVLRLDPRTAVPLVPQTTRLKNMAYEALLTWPDTLVALYEANGANVNPNPKALLFDDALRSLGPRSFPTIEYRVTDATEPDAAKRFWVFNYSFPGERAKLQPAPDSLTLAFSTGRTHARFDAVERLVEFQYTDTGIVRTSAPPLLLKLAGKYHARNWEGIARLDDRGFLIATDEYPETILAFVAADDQAFAPGSTSSSEK